MQIEVKGPLGFLTEFSFALRREFVKNGFGEGPSVGRMDVGTCWTLLKDQYIVTLQLTEAAESEESKLRLEAETVVPQVDEIWDDALISLGREMLSRIRGMARNTRKVEQALAR